MSTSALFDRPSTSVAPGARETLQLTVRNDSTVVEEYRFQVVGPVSAWISVLPAVVSVFPGKSETVTVAFEPPRAASSTAGTHPFAVRVMATERPDNSTVPEGAVTVLPFSDLSAELSPRTSHGGRRGRVRVAIDNRGNGAAPVTLGGTDAGELLQITIQPKASQVEPGAAGFSAVTLRPKRLIWRGQPVTHPFVITITPESAPPLRLDGTFLQEAVIPKWVIRMLLVLLAAVVAVAVVWFALLKPAVESAATQAVSAAVEQASASAQQAADAAKTAVEANGGTLPTETPDTTGPTTTVEPTSFRLTVEGQADSNEEGAISETIITGDTFEVPEGSTLRISDLVFNNPQGDFGQLVLRSDQTTLFTLGLANFRDMDFHFQSPVQVPEGTVLSLDLRCDPGGPVLEGDDVTTCSDAVFVSGALATTTPPAE